MAALVKDLPHTQLAQDSLTFTQVGFLFGSLFFSQGLHLVAIDTQHALKYICSSFIVNNTNFRLNKLAFLHNESNTAAQL